MPEPLATPVITDLALAVGLGLMVGVQREWSASRMAGVRTFALVAMLGALCGLLQAAGDAEWLVAAGLVAVAAMMWLGNEVEIAARQPAGGLTTEFAALVMFLVGVLVMQGQEAAGVVIAGTVAVLLHWKE
ncbi:MAG: MgtC/SapB family protein, partial [Planctomycetota bacterium]